MTGERQTHIHLAISQHDTRAPFAAWGTGILLWCTNLVERGLLLVLGGDRTKRKAWAQLRDPVLTTRLYQPPDTLFRCTVGNAKLSQHSGVGALGDLVGQAWDKGRGSSHADSLAEERLVVGQVQQDGNCLIVSD